MKEWLTFATEHAIVIIDAMALLVIFVGTVEVFAHGLRLMLSSSSGHERRDVWLRYARWLVAGLTFQLAADIVETVLQAIATGQASTTGLAVAPSEIQTAPFIVRIRLDDKEVARKLPAGSTGTAAIFTDRVKASHVIRKVLLRQVAIMNYINPF